MASGAIRTAPDEQHTRRLRGVFGTGCGRWRNNGSRKSACVDRVFVNANAKSTLALGEARAFMAFSISEFSRWRLAENNSARAAGINAETGAVWADKKAVADGAAVVILASAMKTPSPMFAMLWLVLYH